MPTPDKIDQLYDALKADGAVSKSRENFRSYMLASGKQGYMNRKQLYDALKADGAVESATYDEFRDRLGLHAVKPQQHVARPSSTPQSVQQQPQKPQPKPQKAKQQPKKTAWKPSPAQQHQFQQTINSAQQTIQNVNERHKNMAEYSKQRMKHPFGQPQVQIGLNRKNTPTVFDNRNLVQGRDEFNPKTGKLEPTYLTASGNKYNSKVMADAEQRQIDDAMERELQRRQIEEEKKNDPSLWETITKSLGAGFTRAGAGILDAVHQLTSGMIVEDGSSPTGYTKTKSYEDVVDDDNNAFSRDIGNMYKFADRWSKESQPYGGHSGFLDLLWSGDIGGFLQKGVATAGESLPMTLSAFNPYTMALNAISMAGANYRERTLKDPSVPAWKRALMATGSAAIEQAVEKYADPVFKYVGANKILKGSAKEASEKIVTDVTQEATKSLAQRIYRALGGLAKDAAGEGVEEVVTNVGNDALGELLDVVSGDKDYGLRAQWEQKKEDNPDASLWDFAVDKAKENIESFIGGAMAGAYTSGTTQLTTKGLEYAFGGSHTGMDEKTGVISPVTHDISQSYDEGYASDDAVERRDFSIGMQQAEQRARETFDEQTMESLQNNPEETLSQIGDPADQQVALDYLDRKASYDGMMKRIEEDADAMAAQQRELYKQMQHKTDGSLRPAVLKEKDSEGNDQQVYIVDGNVQMMPDGSVVDKAASDNIVVVCNPATGESKQIDPSADTGISSLGEVITAEQREADIERMRQEYVQSQIDEAHGTVRLAPGQQIVLPTGEEAVVMSLTPVPSPNGEGRSEDTDVVVALGDGTQTTVRLSELQRIRDEKAAADYRQRHGNLTPDLSPKDEGSEQPQTDGRVAGAPADYTADMELTIRDEDGSEKQVMVTGRVRAVNRNGKIDYVSEENGPLVEYYVPGEKDPRRERPETLNDKVVSHTEERTVPTEMPQYSLNDDVYLQTEDGEIHGTIIAEENPDGLITIQSEQPIGGRIVNLFTREQLDSMTGNNAGAVQSEPSTVQNDVENVPETTENVPNNDENVQTVEETVAVEPMPMVGEGEDAEPDFGATTPQRAHDYIFNESGLDEADATEFTKNNVDAANKELEKIKNRKPKMGTSIAKFNKDKAEWERKVNEAQAKADYWKQVKEARDKVLAQRLAEQHERERQQIEQAQADEAAYREEMARKEAEQAALGTNNVSPAIRDKWVNAPKVEGAQDEIVLPNGEKVAGRYYLVESGAASASHDSNNGFAKTEGFPVDENGGSVNDRDYERDMDAQRITRDIANNYDSRAVQTPVVVSQDGVVLSGNGRTMAGELAAVQNTDAAYNSHIAQYPTKWGFTQQQVEGMQHPRVVFVPDAAMPYTAETFAKFNQQEMKGQSKTEQAVKLGKVVSDKAFNRIIRIINRFDTLGDFYSDSKATSEAIAELQGDGVLSQAQLAEMVDGGGISAIGKELLENTLIGKAFESNPNAVREITEYKSMRQSIITALAEISNNLSLDKEYSLESELAQAIDLVYQARKSGSKLGEPVSWFARQQNLDFFGLSDTVADYNNATMLMIADIINDNRSSLLKKYIQIYNHNAKDSANGQLDLFTGSVKGKGDIINEVKQLFSNGSEEEQQKAAQEAVARRKAESIQENGTVANGSEGSNEDNDRVEETPAEQTPTEEDGSKPVMSHDEKMAFMRQFLEDTAGDMRLLDVVTDEEVQKLIDLYDAWEVVNDGLGSAHDANDALLNDKNKAIAQKAKKNIETAENAANAAFAPVEDYYNELCDKYGITDEEEPAANATGTVAAAITEAEAATEVNPTDAQKEAGNYKKGHVRIDGFDITIENPKGSVRRGTDASGKQWEQEMHNTYGYIRGTEGVDGDHIDVFFSEDPSQGDVFVVDQVNKDGSFDEHKVMYGFASVEEARKAYLSNYEDGWQGLGAITPVSKEEFKKWIDSSHRKTKPFAEYSSVKPLGDTQLGEQPNKPTVKAGEDYVSAAERIARENEVKRTAAHFAEETQEEATAFDKRVPEMDDAELLAYMQEDGRGDLNKAYHPSVYDEYDYRHGDEQLQSYDDTLVRLNESGTTLEQAEEMLANIQKDVSRLATEDRTMLLGQEEALQEYIAGLEKEGERDVAIPSQQTEQNENDTTSSTIKENGRLPELRTKYPGRVFGEQHEDGSVTFHDEDAMLLSELLGREFDGEDLTLPKKEADKALQKLLANGYKAGYYGAEYKPKYDEHGNLIEQNTDPQPIGNVMLYEPTVTYETRDGKKIVWRSLFDEMDMRGEDETTETSLQNGKAQNPTSFNPSELRLRKLKKGETCHVERVYEETKRFDFTGKEKVESAEDVAYIFRQLENAAVENSFLVLVKGGRPTVIHLGVGSYIGVMAPYEQALVAYRELKPEQVYFVHNHPSGTLKASRQDQDMLNRMKRAFGEDVVQQGIIIDTTSGNYGEFESIETADETYSVEEEMPQSQGGEVPIKVYQFSRQVFAPDWNPESAFKIVSSQSVAEFVSSHRLGEHKKMSFLVVNNNSNVVANVFLPWTKLSDVKSGMDAGELLAGYVHQCGGVRGVLYGNYDYEPDDREVLASVGGRMRQLNAPLMDALHVEHSAYENGWVGVGEPNEASVRDALIDVLRGAGVEVVTDVEEGQRVLDEANDGARMQAKKRALETASVTSNEKHQPTVVSSADGVNDFAPEQSGKQKANGTVKSKDSAKIQNILDNLVSYYEKRSNYAKGFITDIAKSLSMKRRGSSNYRTFELPNGNLLTVRLSKHNANVSNFDSQNELEGISIVVSPHINKKMNNKSGDKAHVVEFYYSKKEIENVKNGKPLAEILKSIKGALITGIFKDTTGLAERQEVNADEVRFFRTADGHAYGFTAGGQIYIDPRIATTETPIHEYSHLWSSTMRELNPEEWKNIVELMKDTAVWDEVINTYPELKTDDEIADEVLAQYSGRRGAERLRAEMEKIAKGDGDAVEKAKAISALERVREALNRFWKGVADWFGIHFTSAEEVADKVLSDLLNGVNPVSAMKSKDGGVRYEANSEEAGIVAKAKAEGTYMKAPNGKPSRLTPRQWVQVRTKAFKEWFGDWEKAAKVLNVVPAFKEHGFKNFDDARSWAKEHIVRTLTDEETGGKGEIRISNNAVAKFLSESAVAKSDSKDVHLSVLKVLPDVIRESVDAEQHPDYKKGEDGNRSVENGVNEHVTIHRLYGAVNVDGKTYRVKVTMKEDRTNNEPQKAYSYEATKIELLAGQHEEAVTSSRNSNNSITAANLLQNVEKSYGNGEKLLDCSKIVDENGEPRVVYHQTNSTIFVNKETGENFDDLNWKEKDYWQNEASEEEWNDTWEEQDFYVFDNKTHGRRSVEMPAFFFSPVYDEYHEYGERTVAAFLNIHNPIVNPDIPNRGVTDTAGEDAMNALIAQGYDGFIREYDGEVEEINAFFPTQIKSAEENVGTFDGANPDIRYQFVGEKGASSMDKADEASVRLDNLAVAREMEAAGKDAKVVKLATGWERGGDGKWRYEIEDFDSSGLENLVREDNKKKLRLSEHRRTLLGRKWEMESVVYPDRYFDEFSDAEREQWDRQHTAEIAELNDLSKEIDRLKKQEESSGIYTDLGTVVGKDHVLFKYYPELEGAVVHITDMPSSVGGNYKPGVITLNRGALYDSSILNHEVQHAIQEIEEFARGGSVRDVRKRIMKRISELDGVSEHAKDMLARQVEYQALASKLGYVYERLMKNGEDWAVRAASGFYWDAMNTLDNDENSKLENAYPKGMNASEIAKEGFNRDKAIEELNRLSDYYASQISAEDMKNIKESETLSGKIDGKSDEELYHALGGEVEARNVQSRLGMTAEERRASLASETEDVARDDQIFLEDGLGESMSESAAAATTESTDTARYRIPEDEPPTKTHNAEKNRHGLDVLSQKSTRVYSAKERREREAYAERQWLRAHELANEIIDKLNISDDITVYESIDEVPGSAKFSAKRRRAKGWYDPRTNKIVVVLGNHRSPNDVLQTILHEAVAHYGLRKLFGKNFETFLDNVYKYADMDVHRRIISMASNKGWDIREATEEYLASLAEDTDFDNAESRSWAGHWFNKIKQLFLDMLHHIGLRDYDGVSLTDNELRYILWSSYKNLAESGHYRNYFSIAEDTVMQSNLHVGDFTEETGQTIEQSTKVAESGLMFRDGDFSLRDRAIARDTYERIVSTGGYQFQEAVQDSMLGLKRLYQSILGKGTRIEDVDGFENAYLAENRMTSTTAAQQYEYYVRYMKPLLKAISDIVGSNNGKRLEMTDYMMAKHGLERNVVMAQRDFDAYQQKYPNGTKTLVDFRERDYAGLTALTGEDDVAMAELAAQQMVDTYEQDHDTSELWQLVNDATAATLAKIYSSGLLSKERYEQIQKMFEYYIPLQGWDETTSDEVYGYLTSKNGPLGGSPIKHAKGRSSKADDPIATIALMADDAIRQGNRNVMKQTFLNFVLNHQSDLVSVNDLWLQYNAVMDEWEPVFADIENTDTAADVERKVEAFEERMQQLAESDPDNYKRGRDAQNIPYKVVKDNLKEHQVLVRRNVRTYVLTINGNPRAAQALNGLTNPDVETGGVVGNLMQGAQWINRNLSAFYTTRNPDFVASNFLRDLLYSNCMTWVKESPKYALRFHKNFGRVNPARMRMLFGKWANGTLDESNDIERLFKQFMLNGGETGYTNIKDIEGHKRDIAAELKRNGSNARKAWQWLGEQLDLLNRSVENCARFAAFVTSREEGRSIERSIYDAKEISVNFNKKGSGGKMLGKKGQERPYLRLLLNPKTYFNKTDRTELIAQTGSYVGGGGRLLYVFWNAGIQGTTNFARAAKRNPIKATAGAASMFMLGAVIPLLAQAMGGDDDDDKNAYYNLPEYVRRSNIIINAGNQWIAIPLPIEFRAFYGLGELAAGVITGNERYSDSELAFQMGSQISQILPLDMLEGGGGINPFVPSIAKPFVEAYIMNKSWTGLPVSKPDTPWNKYDPEWTKAYKSANTYLVSGAKWLNEISRRDGYKEGFIDINPAKVEYLLSGMFGGAFTTGDKLVKMGETIFSDREFDWRNMLIANRVVKTGDERTANRKLSNEYFKYKERYEETKHFLKKYSNAATTDGRSQHRLERLKQSEDYLLYDVFDNYQPILKSLHDAKDGADEATLKSIENEENALRRDMVDLMHAIEDDEKPDINAHVDAMLKREFEAGGRTQKPAGSRIAKRLGGTDSYGSPQNEYGQVYLQMRDYIDLAEDVTLQAALKKAKDSGDTDRAKDIESARRQITEVKKDLTEVPYTLSDGTEVTAKDIMQELRDLRKNLMSELGITTQQQPNR